MLRSGWDLRGESKRGARTHASNNMDRAAWVAAPARTSICSLKGQLPCSFRGQMATHSRLPSPFCSFRVAGCVAPNDGSGLPTVSARATDTCVEPPCPPSIESCVRVIESSELQEWKTAPQFQRSHAYAPSYQGPGRHARDHRTARARGPQGGVSRAHDPAADHAPPTAPSPSTARSARSRTDPLPEAPTGAAPLRRDRRSRSRCSPRRSTADVR
jgi:hypothetical protein